MAAMPDEIIEDHYQWKVDSRTNQGLFRAFGAVAAASAGLAFLA